jgi:hypothetical protein
MRWGMSSAQVASWYFRNRYQFLCWLGDWSFHDHGFLQTAAVARSLRCQENSRGDFADHMAIRFARARQRLAGPIP